MGSGVFDRFYLALALPLALALALPILLPHFIIILVQHSLRYNVTYDSSTIQSPFTDSESETRAEKVSKRNMSNLN